MPKDSDEIRRAKNAAKRRRWRANNPEKERAAQRRQRAKPEYKAKAAEYHLKRLRTKEYYRWDTARRVASEGLLAGRPRPDTCDICSENGRICYDHHHQRSHFRGWICHRCNVVLGFVKDDANLLLQLAAYLKRTQINTSPQLTLPGV